MVINQLLELSMILDADHFQRLFNAKARYLKQRKASRSSIGTVDIKRRSGCLSTLA